MIRVDKMLFVVGYVIIMSGMVVVLSSSPYLFGDYAIQHVVKNKLNGEHVTAQQFLLIVGIVILVGGLCIIIKNKPRHVVN
jgi:energy-converting hydrogenase Eha subunit C